MGYELMDEYSEWQRVSIDQLREFEPKVPNIPEVYSKVLALKQIVSKDDFTII